MTIDVCDGCQRKIAGGQDACREDFDRLMARNYSDPQLFRTHRLFVDTYALQHPDKFCVSAKAFYAHFLDLCAILERGASAATGYAPLQEWLNGEVCLEKPHIRSWHAGYTLEYLTDLNTPEAWSSSTLEWAKSVWSAYRKLHPWARHHLNKITP